MKGFLKCMDRKKGVRWLLAAAAVLVLGLLAEFFSAFSHGGPDRYEVPAAEVAAEGFAEQDGSFYLTGESGFLHIPLDGRYADKFVYSYDYDGLLNVSVQIGVKNDYGEVREYDAIRTEDRNSRVLHTSRIPVRGEAVYADLYVTRDMLREPGLSYLDFDSMELSLWGFGTENLPQINPYRLCFFWCLLGLAAALWFGRDFFCARIEVGFLVISLTAGTLLSVSLPAQKVSWDEEVHFSQAFWMANYRSPVQVSPAILQEFTAGIDTWPFNQPGSLEEQRDLNEYLDEEGDYRNGSCLWSDNLNKTTMTGYPGQALFLKAGMVLGLPFSVIYRLGRLGNLLVYSILLYFAIRRTPVGKALMAFLGLLPEPVLLAGTYSYDPMVTACLYLSFAWMLHAILVPDEKITWKEYAVILISFLWGCRIKAVYAPLLLVGLLIPKDKFRSRREMILMRAGFLAAVGLLMLSFVLPVLLAPRDIGDVRGENTSEKGQMAYILGQPLIYGKVLLTNMIKTFPSYVWGEQSLGLLGHLGRISAPWILYAGSAAVILTGSQSSCGKRLGKGQKMWIFLCCGAAAVLVWTSMYIAFTTPGKTFIDGVQGRYYIPFLFLLWLVMNPGFITVHLKNRDYNGAVLALGGGILLFSCWTCVIQNYCL